MPGRVGRAGALVVIAIVVNELVVNPTGGHALPLTMLRSIAPPICLGALWALLLHSPAGFKGARLLIGSRAAAPVLLMAVAVAFVAMAPHIVLEVLLPALVAACCIAEDTWLAAAADAVPARVHRADQLRHVPAPHARARPGPSRYSASRSAWPCTWPARPSRSPSRT